MVRCFISIDMPDEVKNYLSQVAQNIQGEKINFVEKNKYHITMGFMGNIPLELVQRVKAKLRDVKFSPFEAELSHIGFYPNESDPRIIFVFIEPNGKFKELNREIKKELKKIGISLGKFEAHVTLARVKHIKEKDKMIDKLKEIKLEPTKFKVDNFILKRSFLTKSCSVYKYLEVFKLF